jgi:hypothetical protein
MNDVQTKALLDFLELKAVTNDEIDAFGAIKVAFGYETMTVAEEVAEEAIEVAEEAKFAAKAKK